MREISEIQSKFPTLYAVLGKTYIESLKSEQGALSERATINPFFDILYCKSNDEQNNFIEFCFKDALDKESITLERLQRFRDDKQHINIQNFINEIVTLQPAFDFGKFLDETNNDVTPDFLGKIDKSKIVFECVSVNEASDSEKQRNKDIQDTKKQHNEWKKNYLNSVFTVSHEQSPYGKVNIEKIIDKIRKKKSSRQVKDYQYKILVMSFRNMLFTDSSECLPNKCNQVDGIHSGLIYHAFYGNKNDIIFQGNSFEGERHKLSFLSSDGKFNLLGNNSQFLIGNTDEPQPKIYQITQ